MIVSVSKNKNTFAKGHKHFEDVKLEKFTDLRDIITTRTWSPIIWIQGSRAACNYVTCEYLTLDFDDGAQTIEDIKTILQQWQLAGIIGTSKSHQKVKTTESGIEIKACDRFRVVIPFDRNIEDTRTYTYNMQEAFDTTFHCDTACKDAARYYYPCTDIVHVSPYTGTWPVFEYNHDGMADRNKSRRRKMQEDGIPPSDVTNALIHGIPTGTRNSTCFRIACCLLDCGESEEDIYDKLLAAMKDPIPDAELRRTIANAKRYNGV